MHKAQLKLLKISHNSTFFRIQNYKVYKLKINAIHLNITFDAYRMYL
ncbi:MAG: hypothetical protein ACI8VJ_001156 [Polaribacter sp.]|jgi:hypothetical protein